MNMKKPSFRCGYIQDPAELKERYPGVTFTGKHYNIHMSVTIGTGTTIKNGVKLINGSIVGNNCKIAEGSLIGQGAIVGDQVRIERNATVQDDCRIGNRVSVGVYATVGMRAKISDDVEIRNKAHVYDRAVLNRGVVVEEAAEVRSDTIIYTNAVIGRGAIVGFGVIVDNDVKVPSGTVLPSSLTSLDGVVTAAMALSTANGSNALVTMGDDQVALIQEDGSIIDAGTLTSSTELSDEHRILQELLASYRNGFKHESKMSRIKRIVFSK